MGTTYCQTYQSSIYLRLVASQCLQPDNRATEGDKFMTKLIKSIFEGMGQVLVISPDRSYIRPGASGFQRDAVRLSKDTRIVGDGLRKTIKQADDKSVNNR